MIRGISILVVEIVDGMYCEVWVRNVVEYVILFIIVYKIVVVNFIFKIREEGWWRVFDILLVFILSILIGDGCGSGIEIVVSFFIYFVWIFEWMLWIVSF